MKKLFTIWSWFKPRYTRGMENPEKVERKLAELNRNMITRPWFAAEGFHALNTFKFGAVGQGPTFKSDEGIPIKVFVNKVTGEFKIYSAYLFKD